MPTFAGQQSPTRHRTERKAAAPAGDYLQRSRIRSDQAEDCSHFESVIPDYAELLGRWTLALTELRAD